MPRPPGRIERLTGTLAFKVALVLALLVAIPLLWSGVMLMLGMDVTEDSTERLAALGLLVWMLAGLAGLLGLWHGGSEPNHESLTRARTEVSIACLGLGLLATSAVLTALAALAVMALISLPLASVGILYAGPAFLGALVFGAHAIMIVGALGRAARLKRLYEAHTGTRFDVLPVVFLFVAGGQATASAAISLLITIVD